MLRLALRSCLRLLAIFHGHGSACRPLAVPTALPKAPLGGWHQQQASSDVNNTALNGLHREGRAAHSNSAGQRGCHLQQLSVVPWVMLRPWHCPQPTCRHQTDLHSFVTNVIKITVFTLGKHLFACTLLSSEKEHKPAKRMRHEGWCINAQWRVWVLRNLPAAVPACALWADT